MKVLHLLQLAPLAAAFVVPDQEVLNSIAKQSKGRYAEVIDRASATKDSIWSGFNTGKKTLEHTLKTKGKCAKHAIQGSLDDALEFSHVVGSSLADEAFDARAWLDNNVEHLYDDPKHNPKDPHHGPPHHGPGHDGPHHDGPPHDGPPHDGPHHPPHHKRPHHSHKPNETVYQLISSSKYTTKLAKLIDKFPDLVEALNGTKANYTVFAPTDRAFEKIPKDAPEPSKEQLKKLLSYHVSSDFYPAGRVLGTHTIPTLLLGEELSDEFPVAQRLSVNIGLRGLTLNFYARIIAIDIFASNGVIHGLDSFVLPPPRTLKIIDLLPTEFSTLSLGLAKTGLLDEILDAKPVKGGTLFAPSNFAFQKLGPRINAFLFSKYGQKYLKALLQYHIVPHTTLYSDAVYGYKADDKEDSKHGGHHDGPPRGLFHFNLPTLLEHKSLNVDVARFGGFISIKLNGFARVAVQDGVAKDGVIQVVGDVLIPPKEGFPPAKFDGEMDLEEFKERMAAYV